MILRKFYNIEAVDTPAEVSNEAIRRIPVVEDDDDVSEGVS